MEAWRSSFVRIPDVSDLFALTEHWISMLKNTMDSNHDISVTCCVTILTNNNIESFFIVCAYEK